MFIFEIEGVCIVHLGHLHHTLTPEHLRNLGKVDVLLAAVDGTWTMGHDDMVQTVNDIHPALLVPMHYFGGHVLETFLGKLGPGWPVRHQKTSSIELSKATLPDPPEVLVLPGR
jgi:L-ascorbate metabolism protein UlaG (beta-lactamase superfamily)